MISWHWPRVSRGIYPVLLGFFPGVMLAATALGVRGLIRRRLRALLAEGAIPSPAQLDEAFAVEWLVVAGVLAAVASIWLVGLLLNRWAMSPYAAIARTARELTNGNYTARVLLPEGPSTTLGDLAANLNLLAATLQREEELRGELVSNLAHEIRTPLTNIRGYLEALRDGVIAPDPALLASLHDEVLRMVRLVETLHQFARSGAPQYQALPERGPTDLDELAERLIQINRPNAVLREIRLEADFGARGLSVQVHADSVAQAMGNLLRNAVLYSNKGGTIRVTTAVTEESYRFVCQNTGPGIPQTDLPLVFNRRYRTAQARQLAGGDGIGLAIVKDVVEAHGGRVGADSGDGWTTVWFEVPIT